MCTARECLLLVRDLAALDESLLEQLFGKWGTALAGKARGEDAGGWFTGTIGEESDPKSISHEHTFGVDTADAGKIEATVTHLAEMVARRLREQALEGRTIQIKLRNSKFETITRARTLDAPTTLDVEIAKTARDLLRENWRAGTAVRLIGVQISNLSREVRQLDLLEGDRKGRWREAMAAADKIRDRFGNSAVTLAGGLRGSFRERIHEAMVQPKDVKRGSGKVDEGSAGREEVWGEE